MAWPKHWITRQTAHTAKVGTKPKATIMAVQITRPMSMMVLVPNFWARGPEAGRMMQATTVQMVDTRPNWVALAPRLPKT